MVDVFVAALPQGGQNPAAHLLVVGVVAEVLDAGQHAREGVVDFMRHARSEGADRDHFFSLRELRTLKLLSLPRDFDFVHHAVEHPRELGARECAELTYEDNLMDEGRQAQTLEWLRKRFDLRLNVDALPLQKLRRVSSTPTTLVSVPPSIIPPLSGTGVAAAARTDRRSRS